MAELRTGRCHKCQKHARSRYAVVYRWMSGKGRELYRAHCRHCGDALSQTTFNNLKTPHVRKEAPEFRKLEWETEIGKHDCVFMGHQDRCIYCRKQSGERPFGQAKSVTFRSGVR